MRITNGSYTIYAHINKVNNKIYIGQTCQKPEKRWQNGEGYKNCPYFYNAIKKYGWDNFTHEIIASNLTLNEANNFEELLIEKFNTTDRAIGYNSRGGGKNGRLTEEQKKRISEIQKGRKTSEETIQKLRLCRKNKKSVKCLENGIVYSSLAEAGRQLNLPGPHIGECCNGKRKTCGGFHFNFYSEGVDLIGG